MPPKWILDAELRKWVLCQLEHCLNLGVNLGTNEHLRDQDRAEAHEEGSQEHVANIFEECLLPTHELMKFDNIINLSSATPEYYAWAYTGLTVPIKLICPIFTILRQGLPD